MSQPWRSRGSNGSRSTRSPPWTWCAVVGLEPIEIGDTIADSDHPHRLPSIKVDEPTLHMTFRVNDGPFSGATASFLTSRQISERLDRELRSNVWSRVSPGATQEQFRVSGRGLMHLGILIESMPRGLRAVRVGKPQVIHREINHVKCEPIENLVVDCPDENQNSVMALLGDRRAELVKISRRSSGMGFVHMEFKIPVLADGTAEPDAQRDLGAGDHAPHALGVRTARASRRRPDRRGCSSLAKPAP